MQNPNYAQSQLLKAAKSKAKGKKPRGPKIPPLAKMANPAPSFFPQVPGR